MPSWTSPRASERTLPISRVIARASRSLCWAMSAPNAYRISPRLGAGVRRHIGSAVSAALMAIATSALVPCWNRPMTSRVSAGLRLSKVCAAGGIAPLPGDEVAERGGLDGGLGHGRECTPRVMAGTAVGQRSVDRVRERGAATPPSRGWLASCSAFPDRRLDRAARCRRFPTGWPGSLVPSGDQSNWTPPWNVGPVSVRCGDRSSAAKTRDPGRRQVALGHLEDGDRGAIG